MLIHGLTREGTDKVGLRVMSKRESLGKFIEMLRADGTLHIELFRFIALTEGSATWLRLWNDGWKSFK